MERCEEETMERSEGETMLCADCLRVKKVVCVVCCMLYAVCCTQPTLIYTSLYSPASPPASSPAFSPSYHKGNALSLFGRYSIFPMGTATITGIDEKLCEVRGARTRLTNVQVKDES